MKTIPLARAIELLSACMAVTVGGTHLVFPEVLPDDDDNRGHFLAFETAYGIERFAEADNPIVRIDTSGCLVLLNTKGHTAHLMILNAAPVEAI